MADELTPEEIAQFREECKALRSAQAQLEEDRRSLEAARQLANLGNIGDSRQQVTVVKGTIGAITEYSFEEDWSLWCEILEQYCIANEVERERQAALFLTMLGTKGYALIRDLVSPELPSKMKVPDMMKVMKDHLQPARSVITERYKFKECKQTIGEDIKSYVAKLKKLAMFCEFGNNLDTHLRDQFVWGVSSENIKKKLLSEKDLTYNRAIELAAASEAASRDAAQMLPSLSSASASEPVNFIAKQRKGETKPSPTNGNDSKKCSCCGRSGHVWASCRYKAYKCNSCGQSGHLQKVCKSAGNVSKNASVATKKNNSDNCNFVEETDETEELSDRFNNIFVVHDPNMTVKSLDEPIY